MEMKIPERVVKTYYDALEEGKVLGRKCPKCGHIEFPPYLACNECGNLDTEWVDLTNVRAHIDQILKPLVIFPETEFKEANGGYMPIAVHIENADPLDTSLVHVDASRYDELHDNLENVIVKPYIAQGEDTKLCLWVLEDYNEDEEKPAEASAQAEGGKENAAEDAADDEISKKVIACAADAYETDAALIKPDTDIRNDLSGQSIKLIVLLSNIEDELGVSIEIVEAGNIDTIGELIKAVKEKM